jgi:hypothetical protein
MTAVQIFAAIGLAVVLGGIFIALFVWYRKTPAPKGMENLKPEAGVCEGCSLAEHCEIKLANKQEDCDKEKTEEKK